MAQSNTWNTIRSSIKNNPEAKKEYVKELRSKGYKVSDRIGVEKIIDLFMNHKPKNQP